MTTKGMLVRVFFNIQDYKVENTTLSWLWDIYRNMVLVELTAVASDSEYTIVYKTDWKVANFDIQLLKHNTEYYTLAKGYSKLNMTQILCFFLVEDECREGVDYSHHSYLDIISSPEAEMVM